MLTCPLWPSGRQRQPAALQHLCLEAWCALTDQHQAGEGVAQAAQQGAERFKEGPKLLQAGGAGWMRPGSSP